MKQIIMKCKESFIYGKSLDFGVLIENIRNLQERFRKIVEYDYIKSV